MSDIPRTGCRKLRTLVREEELLDPLSISERIDAGDGKPARTSAPSLVRHCREISMTHRHPSATLRPRIRHPVCHGFEPSPFANFEPWLDASEAAHSAVVRRAEAATP